MSTTCDRQKRQLFVANICPFVPRSETVLSLAGICVTQVESGCWTKFRQRQQPDPQKWCYLMWCILTDTSMSLVKSATIPQGVVGQLMPQRMSDSNPEAPWRIRHIKRDVFFILSRGDELSKRRKQDKKARGIRIYPLFTTAHYLRRKLNVFFLFWSVGITSFSLSLQEAEVLASKI